MPRRQTGVRSNIEAVISPSSKNEVLQVILSLNLFAGHSRQRHLAVLSVQFADGAYAQNLLGNSCRVALVDRELARKRSPQFILNDFFQRVPIDRGP
jgi:hypothetical protein